MERKERQRKLNEHEGFLWAFEMMQSGRATATNLTVVLDRARRTDNFTSFDEGIRRALLEAEDRKKPSNQVRNNVVNIRGSL